MSALPGPAGLVDSAPPGHLLPMMEPTQSLVQVAQARDGTLTYLVAATPEVLPPVRSTDLLSAWDAARQAAAGGEWGLPRVFRFVCEDGGTLDMALADEDACCWAEAVEHTTGMRTTYGLSLCLRLLALVDLLARAPWASARSRIRRSGAALDPQLVRAAATAPLTRGGAFDETLFRVRLGPYAAPAALTASGASA